MSNKDAEHLARVTKKERLFSASAKVDISCTDPTLSASGKVQLSCTDWLKLNCLLPIASMPDLLKSKFLPNEDICGLQSHPCQAASRQTQQPERGPGPRFPGACPKRKPDSSKLYWLSAWPKKSPNFTFTTKMVFPKA